MTRWPLFSLVLATIAMGTIGLTPAACSKRLDDPAATVSSAVPVDPALMAFLSRARAAHHRADLSEDEHPELATKALMALVDGPLPHGGTNLPEVREVLADTHARLADLRSRAGKYAAANNNVDRGLELAKGVSYFRGHLFEMRGLVAERMAAAKERAAEQLLATADDQIDGAVRRQLDSIQARIGTLRAQLDQDPNPAAREELAAAERALARLRLSGLSANRRERHRSLLEERDAAVARALDAFEESMKIQAQVIDARTQPASEPAESAGATSR